MCITVENNVIEGVHSVAIYNPATGLPYEYGLLKILGDITWNNQVENIPLNGGSNPYPWAVGNGAATSELSMTVRQFEPSMQQYFGGAVFTETAASSTGTVSTILNASGTSAVSATTGIASVALKSGAEADLKFGAYAIKVTGAAEISIYGLTDLDFNRGTDDQFENAQELLIQSGITITSSGTTDVDGLGLTFTGGSGTIAMTTGDTAVFRVAVPHDKVYDFSYGQNGEYPQYVGLAMYGAIQADGTRDELLFSKVKANGLNIAFTEKNFSEVEVTGIAVRAKNLFTSNCSVAEMRHARGVDS